MHCCRLQTNVLNVLRVFDKMVNPKCFTHCGFTYDIEKLRSWMQEGMLSSLGRQLEVCLARQVQLQNAKRNAPTAAFVTEDPSSGVPVINPRMTGFGPLPWPHASQHSLDSQVSRTQLAQRVVDRADFFKVPCSLCC